jgi:Flp pilus assembly protein TadD
MTKNPDKNWSLLICLTLTLTLLAVFYQVHNFKFINFDDPVYVTENPNIQAGLTLNAVKWAFTTGYYGNWNPMTWLSLMLDWQLFGSNPAGFHLTSLIFHILNTLLLFLVLKQMTNAIWQSAFVAALFALHPLHVEAVVWISSRKDILSTFFWFLTMWAYVRFVRHPKIAGYLLVVAFLVLGLLSKPMLVTLPFVFLLLDYWPLDRIKRVDWKTISQLILEKIPFFILVVVFSVIAVFTQRSIGAIVKITELAFKYRIYNALISYVKYIEKMFWPGGLAALYPHPVENVSVLYAVISAVVLLTVTILVIRFAQNHRYLVTGWFWYIGTLVPVIGLVQVGRHAMADRYSYITLTGLFIIIAWSLPELLAKSPQRKIALGVSMILVLTTLGICAHRQTSYWENSDTLFSHTIEVTQDNYVVYNNLGVTYNDIGRYPEAMEAFSQAIRIKPDDADAYTNLGIVYRRLGRFTEAIDAYKQAIKIKPGLAEAHNNLGFVLASNGKFAEAVEHYEIAMKTIDTPRVHRNYAWALFNLGRFEQAIAEYRKTLLLMPNDPNVLNEFGYALAHTGEFDEAITLYDKALQIKPDFTDAHINIGYALTIRSNLDQAAVHLSKALQLDPNSALAHYYFGNILVITGKTNEAVTHYEKALQLKPDWVELMNAMAWCLAVNEKTAVRNPDKAVKLARQACELTNYKEPELLDTLSVAYAAAGDFDKAVETAQNALELCRSPEQETLKNEIQNRLILYKAGKPYIEK